MLPTLYNLFKVAVKNGDEISVKDTSSQWAELQMYLAIHFVWKQKCPRVKTYMGSGQWGMVRGLEGQKYKYQR